MKKLTTLFAFIVFLSFSAHAQFLFTGVGVRVGGNYTTLHDEFGAKWKPGFHAGGIVDFEIVQNLFYLQGGVYFTQKNAKMHLDYPDGSSQNWDIAANYVEVPILAVLKLKLNRNSSLYFNIGPAFNVGLFGKLKYDEVDGYFPENSYSTEINTFSNNGYKRFDISAMMGVGYSWKQYSVHFNYDYGFLVVGDKDKFIGSKGNFSGNNIALMLSLGYTFNFYTDDAPAAKAGK